VRRRGRLGAFLAVLLWPWLAPAELPTVASINLCTDQLVLTLADPAQILSLSWLSADPEESMYAAEAAGYTLNYGAAEELIGIGPDVVIAGSLTSPFTRGLLRRLGFTVIEIEPALGIEDIYRNLRQVGSAIDRRDAAEAAIAAMQARIRAITAARGSGQPHSAVVVRPGGYTIGRGTLAFELLELAGLTNDIAELDRWGSLSIETLLETRPEFVVMTDYRSDEASLANTIFAHPALAGTAGEQHKLAIHSRYFSCGAPPSLDAAEILIRQMAAP